MVKDYNERPSAAELLKHPFLHSDLDYENAKEEYMEFKAEVLKRLGKIAEDHEGGEFSHLDTSVDKRPRSKTTKVVK